ncbi:MAG: prephenate dehydratase domain-containing protein [Coriobacteriaceae bacterium]|nr:prephenate dehydratase domain-containing protein [Coriobacteriaceae bacterium]
MVLDQIRERLDIIDEELVKLLEERLSYAPQIAQAKIDAQAPTLDPQRERQKLAQIARMASPEHQDGILALFSLIMSENKAEQLAYRARIEQSCNSPEAKTPKPAQKPFPTTASVACQGTEGAFAQQAVQTIFKAPDISFFDSFEGVIKAVESEYCEFGVLPIENSTAGSVRAVYDLLVAHDAHIVRSLRLKVAHALLARPGTELGDIRHVVSHEQALAQCRGYLDAHGIKASPARNTAIAAREVAASKDPGLAAIASSCCAPLFGLDVVQDEVQDVSNNYTRFIVLSKDNVIFPGANRTSLKITLPHRPGSLYRVLERIYAQNVNLLKIESCPIPGRDFEFVFYFDLETPAGDISCEALRRSLADVCESCIFLGSYQEVL